MVPPRAFEEFNDNSQDRYFRLLRQQAYGRALLAVERSFPYLRGRVQLTGFSPQAKTAFEQSWQPLLKTQPQDAATIYRATMAEQFTNYACTTGPQRLEDVPPGWKAHRFELAIWGDQQLCGLAVTGVQQRHDEGNIMAIDVVVASPARHQPLRGHIRPITQFAGLAWAAALGRREVHGMGPISPAGERAYQRLVNFGFIPEPRGDDTSADTTRLSVARNIHLLKLA